MTTTVPQTYRVEARQLIDQAVELLCRGETREQAQETFNWFVKTDAGDAELGAPSLFGPAGTHRLVVVEDPR